MYEKSTSAQQLYCPTGLYGVHLKILISALNIPLCVTAFLGNTLIIIAIKNVSSLCPHSKLLLSCLAATDFCVGAITQPLFVIYLMSPEHSKLCLHILVPSLTIGMVFCGVSLLTLSAISVDSRASCSFAGATIQTGSNFEASSDRRGDFLDCLYTTFSYFSLQQWFILLHGNRDIDTVHGDLNLLLLENLLHTSTSPNSSTRPCPASKWRKNSND